MKNFILTVMFLAVCFAPSIAKSEAVNYLCLNDRESEFRVDFNSSKVTLKNFGTFANLEIVPPVSISSSSAQWLMKDKSYPLCKYTANVKFYKITDPNSHAYLTCASGKMADLEIVTVCAPPGGHGTSNYSFCAQ